MSAGPGSLARTLEMAIQSKADKEETSAGAFGYEHGSAQKAASPKYNSRFAGDALIGGINGEFGAVANNQDLVNNQDNLKKWAMQWSSGPFSLGGPPPPPGAGGRPPEGAA